MDVQKEGIDTQNYFPLQFGRWTDEDSYLNSNGQHRRTFKGWIDDFRVYDTALKESEILEIFGNGSGDFQVNATFVIPSIVDGDPSQGRVKFTRNRIALSDLDFDVSTDLALSLIHI